jgi:hypothetical protein
MDCFRLVSVDETPRKGWYSALTTSRRWCSQCCVIKVLTKLTDVVSIGAAVRIACLAAVWLCLGAGCRWGPESSMPDSLRATPGVVRIEGSPEQLGRQYGTLLADRIRTMLAEYVGDAVESGRLNPTMAARVRTMKPSLPEWYLRELVACADAAAVDEDVLLFAQCEGDIRSFWGCTTYAAYGPATADGAMEIGRNFDYWGLESTDRCAVVLVYKPRPEDGYAFISVGWTGVLGGWTFLNEHGVFVACNLGGFHAKNPKGVPALVLMRMVAQKTATLDEAIALVRATPRMRGAALVIAQVGSAGTGRAPQAVVVEYDADRLQIEVPPDGFAFHTSTWTDRDRLRDRLRRAGREPMAAVRWAGNSMTLHSVAIRPDENRMWVAHGRSASAHEAAYVAYDIRALLGAFDQPPVRRAD